MDQLRHQLKSLMIRGSMMALALAAGATACTPTDQTPAAAQQIARRVDSAVPREVALTRFRACCGRVDSLAGGESSRDALIRRFVQSIEARDTTALRGMLLNRDEFAWLYYESAPQGLPPYNLSPALLWFMLEGNSGKGLARALSEYGGRPLGYAGHQCAATSRRESANRLVGPCVVRRIEPRGDTVSVRLFGLLIERDGRWKFLSYANKL
jgi:hypothetical protein